jgi:hypothetical protein
MRRVWESLEPDLDVCLRRVAVDFILPGGPRVDYAVAAAERLVAAGNTGEATLELAALSRTALLSDAEPLVRAMLAEHGIVVPLDQDENSTYRLLLIAFGYWDLPIYFFEGPFYDRIPAWDDQGPLDRALVILLDKRDQLTAPTDRDSVEQEMRAVVRQHLPVS